MRSWHNCQRFSDQGSLGDEPYRSTETVLPANHDSPTGQSLAGQNSQGTANGNRQSGQGQDHESQETRPVAADTDPSGKGAVAEAPRKGRQSKSGPVEGSLVRWHDGRLAITDAGYAWCRETYRFAASAAEAEVVAMAAWYERRGKTIRHPPAAFKSWMSNVRADQYQERRTEDPECVRHGNRPPTPESVRLQRNAGGKDALRDWLNSLPCSCITEYHALQNDVHNRPLVTPVKWKDWD